MYLQWTTGIHSVLYRYSRLPLKPYLYARPLYLMKKFSFRHFQSLFQASTTNWLVNKWKILRNATKWMQVTIPEIFISAAKNDTMARSLLFLYWASDSPNLCPKFLPLRTLAVYSGLLFSVCTFYIFVAQRLFNKNIFIHSIVLFYFQVRRNLL